MKAIKAIPGWKELYPAFAAVDALNVNGWTDWYLPAYSEVGNLKTWTSTQDSSTTAWQRNSYGLRYLSKQERYYVVAMHRFSYDFNKK